VTLVATATFVGILRPRRVGAGETMFVPTAPCRL
jgi:hypothetical protein